MTDLPDEALDERAVAMRDALVALGAVDQDRAVPVGVVARSEHNPVPEPNGGWSCDERRAQVVTGWLTTAVRLGCVQRRRASGTHGGRVWRYWTTPRP